MNQSHFTAYLFRLKLISRWPLMRNVLRENVAEHSWQVACVAHLLALIDNRYFEGAHQPAEIALLALYHDVSEVLTGDLPTPIKYHNPQIATEYQKIEKMAQQKLLTLLPEALQADFQPLLTPPEDKASQRLIKQADMLCAYLKCLEELQAGNHEFTAAKTVIQTKLAAWNSPAVAYFIRHFVPSFTLSLDELNQNESL
jgi:5'-deoxynucleotidase